MSGKGSPLIAFIIEKCKKKTIRVPKNGVWSLNKWGRGLGALCDVKELGVAWDEAQAQDVASHLPILLLGNNKADLLMLFICGFEQQKRTGKSCNMYT